MDSRLKICEKCNYEWISRVETPKSCPRCKYRFDYDKIRKMGNNPQIEKNILDMSIKEDD